MKAAGNTQNITPSIPNSRVRFVSQTRTPQMKAEFKSPGKNKSAGANGKPNPLASALSYAKRGWRVFPLHSINLAGKCACNNPDCDNPGKHPRTTNGFKDASADPQQIRRWWNMWPDANVGIATGRVSGIMVLDTDLRNGGIESLRELEKKLGPLPNGPRVKTGDGYHYYFLHPGPELKSLTAVRPGIDTRAGGGNVIAPPSLHESGKTYLWMKDKSPWKLAIPELPRSWLATVFNGKSQNPNGQYKSSAIQSEATRLISYTDSAELFHTRDGAGYANVAINNHRETMAVNFSGFSQWLAGQYYTSERRAANSKSLKEAVNVISAKALHDSPEKAVFTRVAEWDGRYYLDLGDPNWRVIEVTRDGWGFANDPPVRFRRPSGIRPLPTPENGGDFKLLRRYVIVGSDNDWNLVMAWVVAAIRPLGPYPVLTFHRSQGSAKSTATRAVRRIIDPNATDLRTAPRNERDLMISARNSHGIALDNLSNLPNWLSDALCRLATGGGLATRQLYTDDNEVIFEAVRPIVMNGIGELTLRGDLLDRSIVLYLADIPKDQRKSEELFWADFNAAWPSILGGLLNIVGSALRDLPITQLTEKPRMADFALWATAAERGMGLKRGDFLRAYSRNLSDANDLVLDSSPLPAALDSLLRKQADSTWKGTATALLKMVEAQRACEARPSNSWPESPIALSNALRRLAPNLRARKIDVSFCKREAETGNRPIMVKRVQEK